MAVTDKDVEHVTGEKASEREPPRSRAEAATRDVGDMDGRLADLAERERQPGETREGAMSRLLATHDGLYKGVKRAKARAITKAGFGDAATGGV